MNVQSTKLSQTFLKAMLTLILAACFISEAVAQISFGNLDKEVLYPNRVEIQPQFPSPFITEDAVEFVTVKTADNNYSLVNVTVENSDVLLPWGRDGIGKVDQLFINSSDFPTLALNGLHSESELESTVTITGKPVSEINRIGKPGNISFAGFLGSDEDIISVLTGDNRLVAEMGLTHGELAKPLFHTWNLVLKQYEHGNLYGRHDNDTPVILYNGNEVHLRILGTKGYQESLFNDGIRGSYQFFISHELDRSELDYLNKEYSHLSEDGLKMMTEKLTYIHISEMNPYYIQRYGFYEGHTDYRADPVAIACIFGLKSVVEICETFDGKLDKVLSDHYTKTESGESRHSYR